MESQHCPCGSGKAFAECCEPYLTGRQIAPTAEALMRSRYTAYALGDQDYILRTWHPSTRPADLSEAVGASVKWLGLRIVSRTGGTAGESEGWVEFVARCKSGGRATRMHERSRFLFADGQWLYVDGEFPSARVPGGSDA
ncbi:MAG: preprotein translocase subunit SecA [Gammaproteobacteria bacterium SG8_47]|nr:MAG: preprotein translocase subunit SecA [Gammaproteobacteria bacterium SG8_47]